MTDEKRLAEIEATRIVQRMYERGYTLEDVFAAELRTELATALRAAHAAPEKRCKAKYRKSRAQIEMPSEYRSWREMRQRCFSPNNKDFKRYGARGITVCERWDDFYAFYADMGPKPSPKHSIDRYPNNKGNYEPGNCRWATNTEQIRNRVGLATETHCKHGHEFTPGNTVYRVDSIRGNPTRVCRTCETAKWKRRRAIAAAILAQKDKGQ